MSTYTMLTAFLIGFFGLGAGLAVGWATGGTGRVFSLLQESWVHGPLEFFFVLICVAEPLRLVQGTESDLQVVSRLRDDLQLLLICFLGLVFSAGVEVFARL